MSFLTRSPRRRRRSDTPPLIATLTRGVVAFAIVGAFIWLGVVSFNGVPFKGYTFINVSAPQLGNLLKHDPVRIAGVRVGQVASIGLDGQDQPNVRLQIDPGTKLRTGTRFLIRANGLLGARYVELIPGHGSTALPNNARLREGPGALTFGIPDALDTFDQRTRTGLGEMTNNLGLAFLGQGDALNKALRLAPAGVAASYRLDGAIFARPGSAQRLVPSLRSATAALGASRVDLSALPAATAAALEPFVTEQAALRDTLDQAPSALHSANAGLAGGDRLLVSLTGLASQLARTLPLTPAGLRAADALLKSSHTPLARANTLLSKVAPAVPAALKITGSVPPLLTPLDKAVTRLTPMLNYISRYGCNVVDWGATMRSMDDAGSEQTTGPIGWVGDFRAMAVTLSPLQTLGYNGGTFLLPRDTYSPPCSYLSGPYPYLLDAHG